MTVRRTYICAWWQPAVPITQHRTSNLHQPIKLEFKLSITRAEYMLEETRCNRVWRTYTQPGKALTWIMPIMTDLALPNNLTKLSMVNLLMSNDLSSHPLATTREIEDTQVYKSLCTPKEVSWQNKMLDVHYITNNSILKFFRTIKNIRFIAHIGMCVDKITFFDRTIHLRTQ